MARSRRSPLPVATSRPPGACPGPEIVHGAPCRFTDPARFSFAHGGKDGSPFPVPLRVYDETLRVMRQGGDAAGLGNDERLAAIRRLDSEARRLEAAADGPTFAERIAH